MATKICVLHVGTHKTGTTSFQALLSNNTADFERQGLYYPIAGRSYPRTRLFYGHHNLAWELTGDRRYRTRAGSIETLAAELERTNPTAVLLSSEIFGCLFDRPSALSRVKTVLEQLGYMGRVVFTARTPSDYVRSLHAELSWRGLRDDLDSFVACALRDGRFSFREMDFCFDYCQFATGFADVFGPLNIRALNYTPRDSVGPLLRACGTLLGIPLHTPQGMHRLNSTQGQRGVADGMARNVNRLRNIRRTRRRDKALRSELSEAQRRALDSRFGESWDVVIQTYGERPK